VGYTGSHSQLVRHQLRQQLGKFLRERRGDLTLAQFARKTGISDSTLQRLEIAQQNITIDTLEGILKKLKCNVSDIFGNRD
jgi:transcriptional regulator with XRE-family HTH domain